jgi:hypothetical protein
MEALSRLLQVLGSEKAPFSEKYVLTFSVRESGAVTWRLKNQIEEQLSDLCPSSLESLYTSESNNEAS